MQKPTKIVTLKGCNVVMLKRPHHLPSPCMKISG